MWEARRLQCMAWVTGRSLQTPTSLPSWSCVRPATHHFWCSPAESKAILSRLVKKREEEKKAQAKREKQRLKHAQAAAAAAMEDDDASADAIAKASSARAMLCPVQRHLHQPGRRCL